MKRKIIGFLFLAALPIVFLCVAKGEEVEQTAQTSKPREFDNDVKELVKGNNEFAFDLYRQLAKGAKPDDNIFFSPYSISNALAMTYAGARGETAAEMAKVMHFTLGEKRLHPAFEKLIADLHKQDKKRSCQLHIANSLWGQSGFPFLKGFLALTRDNYQAGFNEMNFAGDPEGARQTINKWVEDRTKDKIKELLKPGAVDDQTRLILVNAIYFAGKWPCPFNKNLTKQKSFLTGFKKDVKIQMMRQKWSTGYCSINGVQVVELPYGDNRFAFYALRVPNVRILNDLEESLSPEMVNDFLNKLTEHIVNISIPRFRLNDEMELKNVLISLGMTKVFSHKADFTGLVAPSKKLSLTKIVHKSYLDMNEKGTEATAATAVLTKVPYTIKIIPRQHVSMVLDRPFLFLIRDKQTRSILFMGRFGRPNE